MKENKITVHATYRGHILDLASPMLHFPYTVTGLKPAILTYSISYIYHVFKGLNH